MSELNDLVNVYHYTHEEPEDQGKPFYLIKPPDNIIEKIVNAILFKDELMLNKDISFIDKNIR